MDTNHVFAQAIGHIPALFLIWAIIYAAYWSLGVVRFPRFPQYENVLNKWSTVDIGSLGGFQLRSLALISLISLFLELLLIRWIASEIRIFAYFKSLVLIACFLGFGLGCYLTSKKINLAYTLLPLLSMVLIVELPWDPAQRMIINLSGFIGWFSDGLRHRSIHKKGTREGNYSK